MKKVINESIIRKMVAESLRRTLREMGMDMFNEEDPIVAKARELYKDIQWDDYDIDDRDGGYATGTVYGEVEDENGGVWEFVGSAGFNWEGDWVIDTVDDVEFTSPDGQEGSI